MADAFNNLSIPSCRELDRLKLNFLCQTDNIDEMEKISGYFRELKLLAERLDEKFDPRNRFRAAESFVNTRQMVGRLLQKLHVKIIRRLHPSPNLCNPWQCELSHDVPLEIWDVLLNKVIGHNLFGHEVKTSSTEVITTVNIFDIRKAKYVFNWQNTEDLVVKKELLLKKQHMMTGKEAEDDILERTEVIVSRECPMVFKFNKNSEVLVVTFKYGHWNCFGVPEH